MLENALNSCYEYPIDLITFLLISVALNIILAVSLVRRISMHNGDISTLQGIIKALKKGNWTQ